ALRIDKEKLFVTNCTHTDLQQRMSSGLHSDANKNIWRVATRVAVFSVGAIRAISAIATGRRIVGVDGTRKAAGSICSVETARAIEAIAGRKIRGESNVIAKKNVEFGFQIGMARRSNCDVASLAIAVARIGTKGDYTFLIYVDDARVDF